MARFRLAYVLIALLAWPLAAQGLRLDDCNRSVGVLGYANQTGHIDLGGGIVAFMAEADVNGDASRMVNVVACATGRIISSISACEQATAGFCQNGIRSLSVSDSTYAKLLQIAASPQPYSMDQVAAELAQISLLTRDFAQDHETCGCRVAYPRLRNGKSRFTMEPAN